VKKPPVNNIFKSIEELNNNINEEICVKGPKKGRRNEYKLPQEPA